eukprot:CAMPEP_0206261238 /NCGR_PEP_ID=MMETSP0047_2-20121206/27539_1 /ASSEMBLY_ACC=CAM_ASM_000192 /TAXON_ID=195065 /ORGANISM="Chroomonas mesostigmatica_cf, Strain CCMP1168" /LENGTH=79 /DNA_ID=CAMNT_0053688421 /DNA_START=26 /DNA_END=261 /DNA_ORIENTATION=+
MNRKLRSDVGCCCGSTVRAAVLGRWWATLLNVYPSSKRASHPAFRIDGTDPRFASAAAAPSTDAPIASTSSWTCPRDHP